MILYQNLMQAEDKPRTIVLGNFDGIHCGHQQLIHLGKALAEQAQQELMVFTFYPQLQAIYNRDFKYLISQEKKSVIFEQLGVDAVLAVHFDDDFAKISPEDFVSEILLKRLQAKNIVVGFNYTFGHGGLGTAELLTKLAEEKSIHVAVMPPYYYQDRLVNSSLIRQSVAQGNIELANAMLGYPFSLQGEVIYGQQIGRTIGIPTANMQVASELVLPARGVYAVSVQVNEMSKLGVLNIGSRPTVNNGQDITVEVHILDFDADICGQVIEVELVHHLRGESKFSGLDALKKQINLDMMRTVQLLANEKN